MKQLLRQLQTLPEVAELIRRVEDGGCPAAVSGLQTVQRACVGAAVAAGTGRPAVFLCGDEREVQVLAGDLETLTGVRPVTLLGREWQFRPGAVGSRDWERSRLAALYALARGEAHAVVATADAVGINVNAYKYGAILIGSAIAGLGGLLYVMEYNSGTFDNTLTIQSFGWLAIALVIFSLWKPDLCILCSIIFGALYILGFKIVGLSSLGQQELIKLLPYVITIIVLIITSIMDRKENQPPASLGLNYFREER